MRLSDAIALGRMTIPTWEPGILDGCALGMALNAVGLEKEYRKIRETWSWTAEQHHHISCPLCGHESYGELYYAIAHVFDNHVQVKKEWTLDQLIDWVRSIEPQEDSPVVATTGEGSTNQLVEEEVHVR